MASTYLKQTQGSGDRKTWTFSAWIKRNEISTLQSFFGATISAGSDETYGQMRFLADDSIDYTAWNGNWIVTSRKFRDVNAWYHIVVTLDTTQSNSSDRLKLYVNGIEETDLNPTITPSLNQNLSINNSGTALYIGAESYSSGTSRFFNGSMAHVHFVDGTAYDADTFGETDSTTGIWKPKTAPSVTYGTNGFFLKFENSSAFGTDSSGNSNTFTVNGTMTQTIDTPSNVFSTMNSLDNYYANSTFSNGNLSITTGSTEYAPNYSTLGVSQGKWYFECKLTADSYAGSGRIGIAGSLATSNTQYLGSQTDQVSYGGSGVVTKSNSSQSGTWSSYAVNDIINVAVDLDNNFIYFGKNGTWQNSGDPTSGGSGTGGVSLTSASSTSLGVYLFGASDNANNGSSGFNFNFGNGYFGTTAVSSAQNPDDGIGIFEYDVPAGYRALCTKSINAEEYS